MIVGMEAIYEEGRKFGTKRKRVLDKIDDGEGINVILLIMLDFFVT